MSVEWGEKNGAIEGEVADGLIDTRPPAGKKRRLAWERRRPLHRLVRDEWVKKSRKKNEKAEVSSVSSVDCSIRTVTWRWAVRGGGRKSNVGRWRSCTLEGQSFMLHPKIKQTGKITLVERKPVILLLSGLYYRLANSAVKIKPLKIFILNATTMAKIVYFFNICTDYYIKISSLYCKTQ